MCWMHYRWMIEIDAHRVCVKTVPGNFSCCCWFCFSFSLFADFFGTLYSRVTSKIDGVCLVGVCMHCVQYVLIYERTHTHIQTGLMWTILSIDLWCLPIIFDTAIRTRLLYHIIIGIRRWVCVCSSDNKEKMFGCTHHFCKHTHTEILTHSCS